jgi:excinuclease ABC subunit C
VPLPALTFLVLEGDLGDCVARVPAAPGVGQLVGANGHHLMLAPAANLRKWASAHLGLGKPLPPGRRPKTNLAGIATSVGWACTGSPFAQRLLYERLAAPLIPLSERRDLKPPAFLHLDPGERFPRLTVRSAERGRAGLFGPFRNRSAAEKARDAVNRLFPLRPCDYSFEPDPALPLGVGCLYAQVRSCAAPCLARVSEADYGALAVRAADWLTDPAGRADAPAAVPAAVEGVEAALAVVVGVGRRAVELYPVRAGCVLEGAASVTAPEDLEAAVARLDWPAAGDRDDWPWLAAWMGSARGRTSYVSVRAAGGREGLAAAIRSALPARFAGPSGGDNVGASQGEA